MSIGRIADYELLEPIGQGGMGVVFKARNRRLDTIVALKVLPQELASDSEYRARFLREARAEASLSHASIATCLDLGEAPLEPPDLLCPGTPGPHPERVLFLIIEYVPGNDLQALIGGRPLEISYVLDLVIQITAGLESAHQSGVIHRDLKPTNVRVTPEGRVKILDFGLSRRIVSQPKADDETSSFTTSKGRILGTTRYMSPEQAHGKPADVRSDLFSLGVILYQLVTGRLPFDGASDMEVMYAVANEDPPPLARYARNVPDELERISHKLLAKRPEQRYQSAHEVLTDLQHLREEIALPARRRARALRALALGAAVVAVIGTGWWAYLAWSPSPYRALAVMPFSNRTGDPRLDYLSEGIAASVRGDMVRGAKFDVASLSSTQSLDRPAGGASSIAHELGVQAVLEGSLRREDQQTILDVDLVDGRNGFVLWSERYPYALQSALDVENQIFVQVWKRLTGRAPVVAGHRGGASRSPSAYDLYLRADRELETAEDPQSPDRALELTARALELDPDYALAWAGKSRALWKIWNRDKSPASLRLAEEASDHAVRLNPELLEARLARAQIYRSTSRYSESIRELLEVLRINPNWNEAELQLAASYREAGYLAKAQERLEHAVALRPDYWRNWNALGAILVRRGDYAGASHAFQQIVRLVPDKNRGYQQVAAVETLQGDYDAAIASYEKLPSPVNDGTLASNIGGAYFFVHRLPEANRFFRLALALEPGNPSWWKNLGDLQVREGRADSSRLQYVHALELIDGMIHVDPRNYTLQLDRAVCLAKTGDCAAAETALAAIAAKLPSNDADCAHQIARLNALCGRRDATLQATRQALSLGVSPRMIGAEDEFRAFAHDAKFVALTMAAKN